MESHSILKHLIYAYYGLIATFFLSSFAAILGCMLLKEPCNNLGENFLRGLDLLTLLLAGMWNAALQIQVHNLQKKIGEKGKAEKLDPLQEN